MTETIAFETALRQWIESENRTQLARYGLGLDAFDAGAATATFTIRFLRDEEYCCFEPGCHFPLERSTTMWRNLRQALHAHGLGQLPALTLERVRFVVEEGAKSGLSVRGMSQLVANKSAYEFICGPFVEQSL